MDLIPEMLDEQDIEKEKTIKLLTDAMDRGETYSCGNFSILAKIILVNDGDLEYHKKNAVVYDRQANLLITGELGLRFVGENMYRAEIIEELNKDNQLSDLWDQKFIQKNKKYSEFLTGDAETIGACTQLINEDYIAKIEERIQHNTTFLDELKGIKDDLDPADLNFGESYLTLETAITELEEKIKKLRNLLEFGTSDLKEPY